MPAAPAHSTLYNAAQWLAAAALLILCERLGSGVSAALGLPIPGPVLGMLLLLIALLLGGDTPRGLAQMSSWLLRYLTLLFLPAVVGIFYLRDLAARDWLALATAIAIGTLISLALSALLLQRLLHIRERRRE